MTPEQLTVRTEGGRTWLVRAFPAGAADVRQPEWDAEPEDGEGYVTWDGLGEDAADSARPDLPPMPDAWSIGHRQRASAEVHASGAAVSLMSW